MKTKNKYLDSFEAKNELHNLLRRVVVSILKEIKKRFQEFRKARDSNKIEYVKGKKKFAEKFFKPQLTLLLKKYSD